MREILFKGKRLDNGEWVRGHFFGRVNSLGEIIESVVICDAYEQVQYGRKFLSSDFRKECFRVDFSTVGQYIGLTDKNGVKIFEGDIVHIHDTLLPCSEPYHEFDGYVDFRDGLFCIVGGSIPHYCWIDYDIDVIGNIHDNPELLEGGDMIAE